MDPRPTITLVDEATQKTLKARARQLRKAMPKLSKEDRTKITYVINKYRRKQRKLLEEYVDDSIEDPDPYHDSYVFYCLETEREE